MHVVFVRLLDSWLVLWTIYQTKRVVVLVFTIISALFLLANSYIAFECSMKHLLMLMTLLSIRTPQIL